MLFLHLSKIGLKRSYTFVWYTRPEGNQITTRNEINLPFLNESLGKELQIDQREEYFNTLHNTRRETWITAVTAPHRLEQSSRQKFAIKSHTEYSKTKFIHVLTETQEEMALMFFTFGHNAQLQGILDIFFTFFEKEYLIYFLIN